jgi:putative ABC transport system permease protein
MTQLEARARALPGVTAAGMAMNVPFTGPSYTSDFIAYGRPANGYGTEVAHEVVSPGYFAAMKVRLLRGRTFAPEDRRGGPPVLVINDALARSYFRAEDPIGQRITFDKVPTAESTWYTIIGVVASAHVDALDVAPRREVYHSSVQEPSAFLFLLLRTRGAPTALTPAVRGLVRELDPALALMKVTTMDELRSGSLARARFLTALLVVFGAIGVTLAVVGVYGVLAHVSRNRRREMGIRIALGARAAQVRWLVVRQGLRLTAIGLAIGAAAALYGTRLMTKLLFGVEPNDPATLAAVALLLATTSAIAAWLPALKASRSDPVVTLRAE